MGSTRALGIVGALTVVLATGAPASAASHRLRPRIGGAFGIVAPHGRQEFATGLNFPLVYHGGPVMGGHVTIHAIFWAAPGHHFAGSPGAGIPGYEQLVDQFLADAAHDSGSATNVFSLLRQYPDRLATPTATVSFSAASDTIDDHNSYPSANSQCPSPAGVATCVTDLQVQREIDRMIHAHAPSARGLHDLWLMFLPADVDECSSLGQCSDVFAGYHSLSNVGHGPVIYSVIVDPFIEGPVASGADPEGNPDAESAIDTVAHETVEAITNPEGVGWMDSNGFEVGDKCDNPSEGTPIGFAADGSPYNQEINGHQYLIQEMWSNATRGCEQRSSSTRTSLPLANVSLRQFATQVRGWIGHPRAGVAVRVQLVRAGVLVARGSGTTRSSGTWGPIALKATTGGGRHAVGDDRDVLVIDYGAGGPKPDEIATGNGGNPFVAAGWTGWFDLDNGYAVGGGAILISPCTQTGVLRVSVGGVRTAPPIEQCETETNVAPVGASPSLGADVTMSSEDNRAVSFDNPNGALVKLTIPVGEPDSVSAVGNDQLLFAPTGFPTCAADLRAQRVQCSGLVPDAGYVLTGEHSVRGATADGNGVASFPRFDRLRGGDVLRLANRARRVLSALHVARLQVHLRGTETVIASGRCQAGDYYGGPVQQPPLGSQVGVPGVSDTGTICPSDGNSAGLSAVHIIQTDDQSGGTTRTEVPLLEATAPTQDATVYGRFVALAQTGLPRADGGLFATGTRVKLTITRVGRRKPVFAAANVDTAHGVPVRALARGVYTARWIVVDANGDTRTVVTKFVEER